MTNTLRTFLSAIVILLTAIALAAPMAVQAHGKHPKGAKRGGECSKPSQQTGRIGRHTMGYAVERFKLKGIVSQSDFDRGGKHMNNFLRWKLGGAAAVCAQYVTGNYSHFEKAYSDEAAAMALGILYFNRQDPDLKLPNWFIAYLNFSYDLATLGTTGMVLEKIGLGDISGLTLLRKHVHEQTTKPIFDAVVSVTAYFPKSFDIDNRFVHEAIAARQYSAQGIEVMRRDWAAKSSARSGPTRGGVLLPQLGKKRNLPGGSGPGTGKGLPGSGGSYDPGTDTAYCPGNQLFLPDGSCGCDVNEIQQGDNCILAGGEPEGLPYVEDQAPAHAEGYHDDAPGMEDDRRIQGDTPYYER